MAKYKKAKLEFESIQEKKKFLGKGVILALPLLIGFVWYINLIFSTSKPGSAALSPGRIEPLVVVLLVFIIIYSVFLMFEYNLMKKKIKNLKKIKHHSRK